MKDVATAWRTWEVQSFQVHPSILSGFFGKTVVYYRHCMECLTIFFLKNSQSWVAIGFPLGFVM